MTILRRTMLQAAALTPLALGAPAHAAGVETPRNFSPRPSPWRTFELTTEVQVRDVQGVTRLWLPMPDLETDYQRNLGHQWTGNARRVQWVADVREGVRMLYAEFDAGEAKPQLRVTSRFQTRNRHTEWSRPQSLHEEGSVLRQHLRATELLPTDGIVRETARRATQGARSDLEKVRALYDWVIANAHREPKTRGCGTGDIRTMLETGNLSGKCADLNALFVGLCRACGVPARDVYGVRLAPSVFPYRELGAQSTNLKGAQHCRAEVWLQDHGWVAMDPADVLKVMRQETAEWIKDAKHPIAAPVHQGLFGAWEGNWVGYNTGHDVRLPGSASGAPIGFLMYPQGENASGRFDSLSPDTFGYTISAVETQG